MAQQITQRDAGLDNLEEDCNLWFWKLVHLTGFQSSVSLFVTIDMMFGRPHILFNTKHFHCHCHSQVISRVS